MLNIPNTDSLDGLFSAGLRFLQARQYDKGRLSLARYEMLHLSSADFRFEELGADREFDVPTQLHELFCWIHDYDPLDLLGKPWARYHLELQLLQDSLKKARMDRSTQQVELDLSYATPCKKVYQSYKVYGQMHMDKMKA